MTNLITEIINYLSSNLMSVADLGGWCCALDASAVHLHDDQSVAHKGRKVYTLSVRVRLFCSNCTTI